MSTTTKCLGAAMNEIAPGMWECNTTMGRFTVSRGPFGIAFVAAFGEGDWPGLGWGSTPDDAALAAKANYEGRHK